MNNSKLIQRVADKNDEQPFAFSDKTKPKLKIIKIWQR
jgi:hypothetical protein